MLESSMLRLADLPVMKQITVDDLVKLRPDIGDLIMRPPAIGPIGPIVTGGGVPSPISTELPSVPDDVRPGDLIRAEDWNAVLARLRALDGVLAALAQGTAQLTGRVNDLAGRIPAPAGPAAAKSDKDIMVDFLGSRAVREAMASNPDLMATIGKSKEVSDLVATNLDAITVPILNKAAGPIGPEVEGGPAVMLNASQADTAVLQEKMALPLFSSMLQSNESLKTFAASALSIDTEAIAAAPVAGAAVAPAAEAVAAPKAAGTKTAAVKAATSVTGAADVAGAAGAADVAKVANKAKITGGG